MKYLEETGDTITNEDKLNANLAHDMKTDVEIGE
jgi:hypothetical protein